MSQRPVKRRQQDAAARNKPPMHTRFVKGQSGNPKGRPRGSRNLATIFAEAAKTRVTVTINGKKRKISSVHASALQLAIGAAGGKPQMIGKFVDWIDEFERRAAAARPQPFPFSEADLEVLKTVHARLKRRADDEDGGGDQ